MHKAMWLMSVCVFCGQVRTANILGAFAIPAISHQAVFQSIWKELSLRGHQVTVLTPSPLNDPTLVNLTEIDLSFTYQLLEKYNLQSKISKDLSFPVVVEQGYAIVGDISEKELSHPPVQALINDKTKKFDVVLVEFLHPLMYALSARFQCPLIGVTSLDVRLPGHDAVGNPSHPILNPDYFLPITEKLGLYERLYLTYYAIWFRLFYKYYILPEQDKIARKHLGEDIPYLGDIEKNVSMLFLNVNPVLHKVRPNVPAVIELGKMQITKTKALPKDLQKELNSASKGVVYFSLGTNVRSANLTPEVREKLIGALSELPYKVLWKWEDDHLPGQPKNVLVKKWYPQQDILGHKNVKVFLTQGGLQSMEEAISNGVPLVGMPFLGDQPMNVRKMINLGIAVGVDPERFTKDELKAALIEVAENPIYRNKVREIGDLISDAPMTGLEKAVWWTEYVIRHKGARHLRSPAVDMPLYQYFLLDVIGFVIGVALLSLFVLYKTVKLIWKLVKLLTRRQKTKSE